MNGKKTVEIENTLYRRSEDLFELDMSRGSQDRRIFRRLNLTEFRLKSR